MESQQQQSGQARASSRPYVGAIVHYTAQGGDGLTRGHAYAATITRLDGDHVALHVVAPHAQFDLTGVPFSPTSEIACWTWPAAA